MKKVLIIGLVLLAVGAALIGAGWFATDGDLSALDGSVAGVELSFGGRNGFSGVRGDRGNFTQQGYDFNAAGLKTLEFKEKNNAVRVTASPDGRIHLICEESENSRFTVREQNGTLQIVRDENKVHIGFFDEPEQTTELQLPRDLAATVQLETENGSLTLTRVRLDAQGSLTAHSQNGRMEVRELSAGAVTLKSGNGRIEAEMIACVSLDARSSNGAVKLTDCAAAGDLTVHAGNGGAALAGCAAGGTADVSASNGSVSVDGLAAGSAILLDASNGGIRGTVTGSMSDYHITARAGNGKCNLPDGSGRGDKELRATASNGSIDLQFRE